MSSEPSRHRPFAGFSAEEKRAWASFYARVGKESRLAAEVLGLLDKDAELKRMHLALYLSCRESLRTHQAREARNQRIAHALRRLCHVLFVAPFALLKGGVSRSADIAVASLPEPEPEPRPHASAVRHVRRPAGRNGASLGESAQGGDHATPSPG